MLKESPKRPRSMNACLVSPTSSQYPAKCFSIMWIGNASCPAGTGVCVVKRLVARICSAASSNVWPCWTSSRTRSRSMNAVCPSFARSVFSLPKHANTADSEDNFLAYPMFLVPTVEPRGEFPISMLVFFDIRVHQVQRHGSEIHPPYDNEHTQAADVQFDEESLFMIRTGGLNRSFRPVEQ